MTLAVSTRLICTAIPLLGVFWFYQRRAWTKMLASALMTLAGCANTLVMAVNHGLMPATGCEYFHPALCDHDGVHTAANASTRLLFLADVHGPAYARFSVGDVLLSIALGLFLAAVITESVQLARRIRSDWEKA